MNSLHPDISTACKLADKLLWDAYAHSVDDQTDVHAEGKLVFPRYRGKKALRVSEQEARFTFIEALCRGSLRYSVETPTSKLYQFTGKTPVSAQTDLTLHGLGVLGICNAEFKEGGISRSNTSKIFSIYKDLQKLLREPRWGLWFHLLESVDNCTINKFLRVMVEQISKVQNEFEGDIDSPGLTLHICVLRHRFSLQKDILFPIDCEGLANRSQIDLNVSRRELKNIIDLNGWNLNSKIEREQ